MEDLIPWVPSIMLLITLLGFAASWKKIMTREDCEKCQKNCREMQEFKFAQGEREFTRLTLMIGGLSEKIDTLISVVQRIEIDQAKESGRRATDHI